MKNFEDISCAFCGEKNTTTQVTPKCVACGGTLLLQDMLVGQQIGPYLLSQYVARGFYGLTFKVLERISQKPFALKLIPAESYRRHGKDFQAEVQLYGRIPDTPLVARYISAGEAHLNLAGKNVCFHYIVSEWVPGEHLGKFLQKTPLQPEHLRVIARDLISAIDSLYEQSLWHNDLHDENILVKSLSATDMRIYSRTVPHMFVVVDVGSMVFRNPHDVKQYSDMTNVGSHIATLSSKLTEILPSMTKEDQCFADLTQDITTKLMDETPGRAYHSPSEALVQLDKTFAFSRLGDPPQQKTLTDPYGYVNANDIPSSWLLRHMFSEQFAYFRELNAMADQCVVITGPRGCGKTMLLKNMRFVTSYDSRDESPETFLKNITHVGLFFSARTNFGNYLVSYRPQEWIKSEAKVMLYFNLLVTIELIDVLYRLYFDQQVTAVDVSPILTTIMNAFEVGAASLLSVKHSLVALSRGIINDSDILPTIRNSTPSYLTDLFESLKSSIPMFRNKPVVLLVDDLTWPRVPFIVQKALIPALFNTGANYRTRVTAHSDGLLLQDSAGEVYRENRDFRQVNLGYEYWKLSDNYLESRDGFDDILKRRFQLAASCETVGIETIVGVDQGAEEIGRKIHRLATEKKLRTLRYHGAHALVRLCSGDLSYLLDLLGKMARSAGKVPYPIPINIQHSVIRNYARNELLSLQDIKAEIAPSMYNIAYYFGVWSKSKLIKMDDDYLRIELGVDGLSKESVTTKRELLCHGIFIDGGQSNMNDGGLAHRLLFRRIYVPAFPTTFNNANTFPMRDKMFLKFICYPADFVRAKMSADGIPQAEQLTLEQLDFTEDEPSD